MNKGTEMQEDYGSSSDSSQPGVWLWGGEHTKAGSVSKTNSGEGRDWGWHCKVVHLLGWQFCKTVPRP